MIHAYFEIENFKGIERARIDFTARPRSQIYTLVGLNESGKTTVLEALHFLNPRRETLDTLGLLGYSASDVHELIPISKRFNFNESIVIRVGYQANEDDNAKLKNYLQQKLGIALTKDIDQFEIEQSYSFTNSEMNKGEPQTTWSIDFVGKRKRNKEKALTGEEWETAADYVEQLLPSVLYFPNFLFEFPDRIYLDDPPKDEVKHRFYRTILQDILDSIGENANLNVHVLERARSNNKYAKQALDSMLLKMGNQISETVIKQWNQIFKQSIGRKEIIVSADEDEEGRVYLQLRLRDGDEQYSISERSLGFRWFFAFLLLTQYRGFRKQAPASVLFLFDEPASNLHPSAQAQLLDSFGKFPPTCSIIYTTHSHHLINPNWLENTYVVKNEGLAYEKEDDSYTARNTVVTLERYRAFAAKHPDQQTYFQPILDVLDYSPSQIANVPNVIMVEGKNDFYTLKYFQDKVLKLSTRANLMPGGGSGNLDTVIRLYTAWGRDFVVLLDADKAGVREKKRYTQMFGSIVEGKLLTLDDICPSWNGFVLEDLVDKQDQELIQKAIDVSVDNNVFSKSEFNRAIQELYLTEAVLAFSETTTQNFKTLIESLNSKLAQM